jgi:hypothetical protein
MSGFTCDVPSDGLASTVIQSTSNSQGSIEGHTISRTPEVCFGAVCLELPPWAGYGQGGFLRLLFWEKKPRVESITSRG